jgi:hypothetical protein
MQIKLLSDACVVRSSFNFQMVSIHAFSCGASRETINGLLAANQHVNRGPKGAVIHRHNKIRDALCDFIKTACPEAPIYKEHNLPPSNNVQLRTDLALVVGGDMVCVDVQLQHHTSRIDVEYRRNQRS